MTFLGTLHSRCIQRRTISELTQKQALERPDWSKLYIIEVLHSGSEVKGYRKASNKQLKNNSK